MKEEHKTQANICPECGTDVPVGVAVCPDCSAFLVELPDRQANKPPSSGDTIVEKELAARFDAQIGAVTDERPPPLDVLAFPPSAGVVLAEVDDDGPFDDLELVSAQLIVPSQSVPEEETPHVSRLAAGEVAVPEEPSDPAARAPRPVFDLEEESSADFPPRSADYPPAGRGPQASSQSLDAAGRQKEQGRIRVTRSPAPARDEQTPVGVQKAESADRSRTDVVRPSMTGLIASELEAALGESSRRFGDLDGPDRITMISATGLVVSTFLPWFGRDIGMLTGGGILWLFVTGTLVLLGVRRWRIEREVGTGLGEDTLLGDPVAVRTLNLVQILVATGALFFLVLVLFGMYYRQPEGFEIRFGWYVALFFSTGLAYSGIARFSRDAADSHSS